ncbi:MAG: hypothetical protein CMJ76_09595 [Planctomycetaceae bacterium]|nr:hypothetical protein [Planctomycetaceae bacterium]|tara:strand:+ start:550 stop:921 length:372 start_codon:yes stop_codon:yes gene_type:complete
MSRFVILFHEPGQASSHSEHFDFMLESLEGTALATWRWERIPIQQTTFTAIQLPPHRLAYLEYEGAVSGDRGKVTRSIVGIYKDRISLNDSQWEIKIESDQLQGTLNAQCLESDRWQFEFTPI